ncbi:MAG: SRPBCC family protein [Halobacteriota archaeon]
MPTFQRTTVVDAPLEAVWAFHSTIDGLRALTPPSSGLEIDSIVGPDGTRNPETLTVGTTIEMRVRPLGVLPGPGWTSEITLRERDDDRAVFRDTMDGGPFETWEHTHRFVSVDEQTLIYDDLEFALAPSLALFTPFVYLGLAGLFTYRHARTRSILAG